MLLPALTVLAGAYLDPLHDKLFSRACQALRKGLVVMAGRRRWPKPCLCLLVVYVSSDCRVSDIVYVALLSSEVLAS